MQPIKKSITLKDQAYQEIKKAIYSNALLPGTPLTEEHLSTQLSISRTPIRSALQMLVHEKLATKDKTGHIFVSTITEKDVKDVTTLRLVLEPMTFEVFDSSLYQDTLESLMQQFEQHMLLFQKNPSDNYHFAQMDYQFHCLLSQFSNNKLLKDFIQNLNNLIIRINILSGTLNSHKEEALKEHAAILDYLKKKEFDFVKAAITQHIKNVEARMFF